MVTALMRAGCNVNSVSGCCNKTALATAAFAGNVEVFELLANQGGKSESVSCFVSKKLIHDQGGRKQSNNWGGQKGKIS